jgi:tetratricopeptide (TPR) repeat protein
VVVSALLGGLSKENAWIIPALILLAEYGVIRNGQRILSHRLDYIVIGLPVFMVLFVLIDLIFIEGPVYKHFSPRFGVRDFTLHERLLTQPRVIFFHLSQILWPLPGRFSLEHDFVTSTSVLKPFSTLPALAGLIAWVGSGVWLLLVKNRRILGFWLLWVPVGLAIESSAVPLEMIFEHRMYLPSVGLAGLLASRIYFLFRAEGAKRTAITIGCASLVLLLVLSTRERVPDWQSNVTLYEQAVRTAPKSSRVRGNLGMYLYQAGQVDRAVAELEQALVLDPNSFKALENLGVIMMDLGNLKAAEDLMRRAVLASGSNISTSLLNHLGELALKQEDFAQARFYFYQALKAASWNPVYYWNLAFTYEQEGSCAQAYDYWRRYLQLQISEENRKTVEEHLVETYSSLNGKCHTDNSSR